VRLYLKSSYIGYILQDVGLPRPPAQDQDSFSSEISLEQVADIDADYIFITGYAQDDSDQETFLQSELWTTLGAVQNEQAIDVNDDTWIAGLGVQSANLVLDDLISLLDLAIDEAATAPVTADSFPVTIDHKYGSTTIVANPERIVTVGLTDHDALLALGIVPVGTSEWFGGYPGSIWPWAQDELAALGGEVPAAVGGEAINFEAIAGLQPDLILALYAGVTQEEYDLLTQIAPTVAQPGDYVDYGIPWQELTLTVGKVVGQAAEAAALVTDVEAQFAQVQVDHPEFTGATAIVATPYQGIWVYGEQDVRGRFLTMLGFQLPAGLQEITGTEFGGNLSMERADLLDVAVIIWLDAEEAEGELGGPVYQSLPVHTEGREVHLSSYNDPLGGATSFVSVLSLPFLLEGLVPQLADALAGSN
jgi:iron complex transport system substrate-binding protein